MKYIFLLLLIVSDLFPYDFFQNSITKLFSFYQSNAEQFINAAEKGDIPKLQQLLDKSIDVNILFDDKTYAQTRSALSAAIISNQIAAVQFLIDNRANVNQPWRFGNNLEYPISLAIKNLPQHDNLKICILLLSAGANIDLYCATPPIIDACTLKNSKAVDLLLAFGSPIYDEDKFYEEIDISLWPDEERREIQRIISSLNVHRRFRSELSSYPSQEFLKMAITCGYIGVVKQTIEHGIHPNLTHLQLARDQYFQLQSIVKDKKSFDGSYNPFTLRDKEIYTQAYREIGKKLIEYLRITDGVGCKKYPAISKKGIESSQPNLPKEIVRHIAWYAIT